VVLARRTFRGSGLLEAVVDLPIVLPPAVAGLGLLLVFGRRGLFGEPLGAAFGISIPFTTFAVVLAQVFVSAPFFIRSARTGLGSVRASSRTPPASTAPASSTCSGGSRSPSRARRCRRM
jgi:molybdate transport system permease protein